jgi:ABC-type multidrug transport system fused ATPase/permease subunit
VIYKALSIRQRRKKRSLHQEIPTIWTLVRPYSLALLGCGLLLMICQMARLFVPFSTKYLVDVIALKHQPNKLPWLVAAAFIATLIEAATLFFSMQLITKAGEELICNLRKRIQAHIVHLPVSYFDGNLAGTLVSRVMLDVEGLRNLVGSGMANFCLALLAALITVIFLAGKAFEITMVIVFIQLLAVLGFHRAFGFYRPIIVAGNKIRAEVTGRLTESMGGVRVIKGYRAEKWEVDILAQGVQKIFTNAMEFRLAGGLIGVTGTVAVGLTSELLMFGGGRYLLKGVWTTGDYVQYSAMLLYLINPIFQLVIIGTQLNQAVAGLDRIREVLSEPIEDADEARTTKLPVISGEVRVQDVTFAYEKGRPVLHEIDFESGPGMMTALVGPSGSGKSTIVSLISAFHKPTGGRILIDGIDLSTVILDSYRSQLGLVLQETFLFDGSIRENVLYSRPGTTEASFLNACRIAHVHEFAEQLPESYNTIVGERGVKLSGGQRQRISIARAIVADPRILILDEATSSLDSESEAMIQEGLRYLMRGRTTFMIAHRLSTIREANQILVLAGGRIVERGTHESLFMKKGRYYELYTRQHGLETAAIAPSGKCNM